MFLWRNKENINTFFGEKKAPYLDLWSNPYNYFSYFYPGCGRGEVLSMNHMISFYQEIPYST